MNQSWSHFGTLNRSFSLGSYNRGNFLNRRLTNIAWQQKYTLTSSKKHLTSTEFVYIYFMQFLSFFTIAFFILPLFSQTLIWDNIPLRSDLYKIREEELSKGLNFDLENEELIKLLNAHTPGLNLKKSNGITKEQGQEILNLVREQDRLITETPEFSENRKRGICFGRAIFFHLLMLKLGVDKNHIKKIFAIGSIDSGEKDLVWQFHTAIIVKDLLSEKWWALDVNHPEPLSIDDWKFQINRRSLDKTFRLFREPEVDKSKSIRFYITHPNKIGPSGWEYNIKENGLFDPFYNNYFHRIFGFLESYRVPLDKKLSYINHNSICQKLFL